MALKDAGFKAVLANLQGSGQEYQNAVPLSAQVQPLSPTTTKYNLVIEVAGRKQ